MTHSERRRSRRNRGLEAIAVAEQPPTPASADPPKMEESPIAESSAPEPAVADPVVVEPPKLESDKGLVCPQCGGRDFFTGTVRKAPGGRIWRRRECRECGRLVSTYEQIAHR